MAISNFNTLQLGQVRREDTDEDVYIYDDGGFVGLSGKALFRCSDCWMNGSTNLFRHDPASNNPICPDCDGGNTEMVVVFTSTDFTSFLASM